MSKVSVGDKVQLSMKHRMTFTVVPMPVSNDKRKRGIIRLKGSDGRNYEALESAFEVVPEAPSIVIRPPPDDSPGWYFNRRGECIGPASYEMREAWEKAGRNFIEINKVTKEQATIGAKRTTLCSFTLTAPPQSADEARFRYAKDVMGHEPYPVPSLPRS